MQCGAAGSRSWPQSLPGLQSASPRRRGRCSCRRRRRPRQHACARRAPQESPGWATTRPHSHHTCRVTSGERAQAARQGAQERQRGLSATACQQAGSHAREEPITSSCTCKVGTGCASWDATTAAAAAVTSGCPCQSDKHNEWLNARGWSGGLLQCDAGVAATSVCVVPHPGSNRWKC